jgi:hypothetical protein
MTSQVRLAESRLDGHGSAQGLDDNLRGQQGSCAPGWLRREARGRPRAPVCTSSTNPPHRKMLAPLARSRPMQRCSLRLAACLPGRDCCRAGAAQAGLILGGGLGRIPCARAATFANVRTRWFSFERRQIRPRASGDMSRIGIRTMSGRRKIAGPSTVKWTTRPSATA